MAWAGARQPFGAAGAQLQAMVRLPRLPATTWPSQAKRSHGACMRWGLCGLYRVRGRNLPEGRHVLGQGEELPHL